MTNPRSAIFGADAFTKGYWFRAASFGAYETTNQYLTNGGHASQLDVLDIFCQSLLGLNTASSASLTSFADWKPFSGSVMPTFNFNSDGATDFVFGFAAGKARGLGGMVRAPKPFGGVNSWSTDLLFKYFAGKTKGATNKQDRK